MGKMIKLSVLLLCANLSAVSISFADSDELEIVRPQVYDLGQEPKPPVRIKRPTLPPRPAPKMEVPQERFEPAPPPPPRVELPPQPSYQPPPQMVDDPHFIQADDYFIQRHGLENHTWIWVELAKMVTSPAGNTKGEAEFMKVRDGKNYWTSHFWRTRVAYQNELRLGMHVIAFNDNHSSIYDAPLKKDRARGGNWFMARITDMSDIYKGYVTVSGNYKVGLRNLRVIVR